MITSVKLLGLATFWVFVAISATAQAADNTSATKSYLFIETADRATLSDGTLTFYGVSSSVPIFTDRPYHQAGQITRAEFTEVWGEGKDSFKSDPPNAAITGFSDGKQVVLIAEIDQPNGDQDQVSYKIKILDGTGVSELQNPVMVIDYDTSLKCFLGCVP